jgi:hypothetical protein
MNPLLAHLGSAGERGAFPVLGVKRTSRAAAATAGFDPQQSFRPDADAAAQTRLFDGLLNDPGSLRLGEHRHEHS